MTFPGYWMNEASGVLRPVVERYLAGGELLPEEIETMRVYLRQWMLGPWGGGAPVERLRERIDELDDTASLRTWLDDALDLGIDPL